MKYLKGKYVAVKNLHLAISVTLIIPIAVVYGMYPNIILPGLFDCKAEAVNQANIFRGMMGLYLGMATIWIISIIKFKFWASATITNIFFMGGLAFGRLISLALDGIPGIYFVAGIIFESALAFWGLKNLQKYGGNLIDKTAV